MPYRRGNGGGGGYRSGRPSGYRPQQGRRQPQPHAAVLYSYDEEGNKVRITALWEGKTAALTGATYPDSREQLQAQLDRGEVRFNIFMNDEEQAPPRPAPRKPAPRPRQRPAPEDDGRDEDENEYPINDEEE
jgi:YD repeat-containing protein